MTPARVSSQMLTAVGEHLIPFASGITAKKFKKIAIEKEP
jgi:hypothetical protein